MHSFKSFSVPILILFVFVNFSLIFLNIQQMKLIADIDRMIDLEKERLEVDRRDSQILRAQLAFQLLGQTGQ